MAEPERLEPGRRGPAKAGFWSCHAPGVARLALLVLGFLLTALRAADPSERNLLGSGSFQPGSHDWIQAGEGTSASVDPGVRHSIGNALRVADEGTQMGQATTPHIPAKEGEVWRATAWARLDPGLRDQGLVDIEFYQGSVFIGALQIGAVTRTEWQKVSGYFPVLTGATSFVLRFMPATTASLAHGAGWIDDLEVVRLGADDLGASLPARPVLADDSDGLRGEPPRDRQATWFPHPPSEGFEDLSGWTCAVFAPAQGEAMRSRGMPLAGDGNLRLSFSSPDGTGWALLRPAVPPEVREPFDHVQLWVYGMRREQGVAPVVVLRGADGQVRRLGLGQARWPYWSILDVPLGAALALPARLVALEVWGLATPTAERESVYFDNLAFYRESPDPIALALPAAGTPLARDLPISAKSVVPTPPPGLTTEITRQGPAWCFRTQAGADTVEYRYEPRTGTLSDLSVTANGMAFGPCAGGGVRVLLAGEEYAPDAAALRIRLLATEGTDTAPEFRFRVEAGQGSTEVSYRIRLVDASLVIDVGCASAAGLEAGRPAADRGFRPLLVPYLTYGPGGTPVLAGPGGLFGSWLWDYYRSDASQLSNTASLYLPLTDGRRNPLRDRLVLTFSRRLQDVLPNIPNPAATQAPAVVDSIYCATSGPSATALQTLALWRQLKRYGVEHLIAKQHAEIWSPGCGTGMVPFFQNPHASPAIPGGDDALTGYIAAVKALGYRYALYTDYVLTTPVEAHWNEADVARAPDGSWVRNWYQAFQLTPLRAWERAAHFAPRIAAFGNDASYCDQHTSGPPWNRTDYDARKPLAGMFRPVIASYAATFEAERRAYGGPVFSEGDHHWLLAGLCDGNYAQFHPGDRPAYRAPLLVDFDLLKIHPLEMDLGMGWQEAYGLEGNFDPSGAQNDRLLAATIAFGHAGLLYAPWNVPSSPPPADPLGAYRAVTLRTYFMTQQAQLRYLLQPVSHIEYHDGRRFVDTGTAIHSGALDLSRVHVVYANGLQVWVNGGFGEAWDVDTQGDGRVLLPPAGYAVRCPGEVFEYSALVAGHRVDLAVTPAYVYADARGELCRLGPLELAGAVVLTPLPHGIRAISISGEPALAVDVPHLPFAGPTSPQVQVTFEDEAAARRETSPLEAADGLLRFRFPAWARVADITRR